MGSEVTPNMTTPTDDDLKPFGWAPGHYTIPCDCVRGDNGARLDKLGAKRCTRCRECAEAAWREAGMDRVSDDLYRTIPEPRIPVYNDGVLVGHIVFGAPIFEGQEREQSLTGTVLGKSVGLSDIGGPLSPLRATRLTPT